MYMERLPAWRKFYKMNKERLHKLYKINKESFTYVGLRVIHTGDARKKRAFFVSVFSRKNVAVVHTDCVFV